MDRLAHFFSLALLVIFSADVLALESIVVASSFPKEVLVAYKKAFDERNPQYRLEFVNFPGTNIIPFLTDRTPGSRPDVFWSSSPDSFRALLRHGLLQTIGSQGNPSIPSKIGSLNIDDPDGFYKGQALSGYGIMWNTRYLSARTISPPGTWSDLVKPELFGHVVMSSPSRSGTTHLIVESILQGAGWENGWSLIIQIAGNCATITDRSFDVPNSITSGRFGVGLVVDFLALSGKYSGFPVDFTYAWPSAITPASIGLVTGARNSEGGLKFITFALSKEGQSLLLRSEISRLPVLPEIYASTDRPADYPDLFDVIKKHPSTYNPDISEARHLVVNAIFNQVVTFRHRELVDVTKAIQSAERLLIKRPHAEAGVLIDKARALIYRPPVSEKDELTTSPQLQTRAHIAAIAAREAEWARQTSKNYVSAKKLVEQALAMMQ
ncbi:extracellular solute-binding protein [Propionivibrio sp.]|uniref:ABC transporter substrate-binding protein n=1 Tax=Propionivibrio sp. TaxID=2212460 RepID=UPI0026190E01|nr:extracellular solute-binding protein [Propionivibrio sp.]